MTKCKECQADISAEAAACPHCGHPAASAVVESTFLGLVADAGLYGGVVIFLISGLVWGWNYYIDSTPGIGSADADAMTNSCFLMMAAPVLIIFGLAMRARARGRAGLGHTPKPGGE